MLIFRSFVKIGESLEILNFFIQLVKVNVLKSLYN